MAQLCRGMKGEEKARCLKVRGKEWLEQQKVFGFLVSEYPQAPPSVEGWWEAKTLSGVPSDFHQFNEREAKSFAKVCEEAGLSANVILWKDEVTEREYKASVELVDLMDE